MHLDVVADEGGEQSRTAVDEVNVCERPKHHGLLRQEPQCDVVHTLLRHHLAQLVTFKTRRQLVREHQARRVIQGGLFVQADSNHAERRSRKHARGHSAKAEVGCGLAAISLPFRCWLLPGCPLGDVDELVYEGALADVGRADHVDVALLDGRTLPHGAKKTLHAVSGEAADQVDVGVPHVAQAEGAHFLGDPLPHTVRLHVLGEQVCLVGRHDHLVRAHQASYVRQDAAMEVEDVRNVHNEAVDVPKDADRVFEGLRRQRLHRAPAGAQLRIHLAIVPKLVAPGTDHLLRVLELLGRLVEDDGILTEQLRLRAPGFRRVCLRQSCIVFIF
mmetsp:Transcript_15538/g.59057  ORF Transcript_15538/g.59057 Transcript_15538/m.59057 type:complete len:331 (-) Transcript_15538:558-1550(-)